MITITLEASKALCDYLNSKGVKLPETYLYWDGQKGHSDTFEIKLEVNYRRAKELDSYMTPAITFSELITDWLPLLETIAPIGQLPTAGEYTHLLKIGGMFVVSICVIELVKDLLRI